MLQDFPTLLGWQGFSFVKDLSYVHVRSLASGLCQCNAGRGPFIGWPGWAHLRFAWLLSALNAAWFGFVYAGCDWITARRSLRVPIHLPIELRIPFVPGAVAGYMSVYLLFIAAPFIVRSRSEFTALIRAFALATLCGGIGFLLVPAQPAYPPPGELGAWADLFHFADWLNLDYNMAPSLHVALSVCCIAAFCRYAAAPGRWLLWSWACAIALSTLLTHQHHLIDVLTGWWVGMVTERTQRRSASRSQDFHPLSKQGDDQRT